jgi:agmatine deiminase
MKILPGNEVTPSAQGYAMPAEWSRHRATWLAWPHNRETWPSQLARVQEIWLQMIIELAPHERVCLLVNDAVAEQQVVAELRIRNAALHNVSFLQIATVDVWMRDYGPTFITSQVEETPLALNDWVFNGWGGKYKTYEQDDDVAKAITTVLGVPTFEHPVVLEGGSIEVNGAGICLTTEQCLLNKNRNPHMTQRQIENFLKYSLGVSQVIWLGTGIAGDDTDGHIDDIARFIDSTTLVCARENNPRDENYIALEENFARLCAARDVSGGKFEVIALPCPSPLGHQGERLPASYVNFYVANEVVLAPVFKDPADTRALGILQELFPTRKVIGLECVDVVAGLGAIHCVTQQEPWAESSNQREFG